MPAPHWFFRFMYDREKAAWERRRDEPEHRELVERTADELTGIGCNARTCSRPRLRTWHALAGLAGRGYDVVGVDGSPRMVEVARTRAAHDEVDAVVRRARRRDRAAPLRGQRRSEVFLALPRPTAPPASRGFHRRDPALPPAGRAPVGHRSHRPRTSTSLTSQNLYWRLPRARATSTCPASSTSTTRTPSLV